jgi:hypothetical protein
MRGTLTFALTVAILAAGATPALSAPPNRPTGLTLEQYEALCQIESQAVHASVLDVHATYASEREQRLEFNRIADDISTGIYQIGFPSLILTLLFTAGPL